MESFCIRLLNNKNSYQIKPLKAKNFLRFYETYFFL